MAKTVLSLTNIALICILELEEDIESSDLQAMFDATFRHDMRQRLQRDKDYRPSRHPNSEEYFIKGFNSKQNKKE